MIKKTLKNNLRFGLGLSLLLLFISSFASYVSISNLIKNSKLVSHSNSIIRHTEGVLSTLKDAETGQRGFLLTGEEAFLEPYNGAKAEAILLLDTLQRQTTDNPAQQVNINKLRETIEGRLSILEKTIAIKRKGGSVSIGDLLAGKAYMDNARKVIKTMQAEEQNLLTSRTANQNKLADFTPVLILLAAFLAILITIFFYRRVSSDFNERMKLQEELEHRPIKKLTEGSR
ncbi:CHASE3 domain-containing protein [Pedobacter sp. NJ-S-72]